MTRRRADLFPNDNDGVSENQSHKKTNFDSLLITDKKVDKELGLQLKGKINKSIAVSNFNSVSHRNLDGSPMAQTSNPYY